MNAANVEFGMEFKYCNRPSKQSSLATQGFADESKGKHFQNEYIFIDLYINVFPTSVEKKNRVS